jgi:hypothetical protein
MQLFKGLDLLKDDTILWFIILFILLFFCGYCGNEKGIMNRDCD